MLITIKYFLCLLLCCGTAAAVAETQNPAQGALPPTTEAAPAPGQSKKLQGKTIPLITIFGSAEGPKFEEQVPPEYPFAARKRSMEGTVVLRLSIDELGMLQEVEVLEATDPLFIPAAINSVKKSFFIPAKNNRRPVPSQAILPVHFRLKKQP